MKFPGEDLLIKLIDTLEKGIGTLGRPWQLQREEAARAKARKTEMLVLEQARIEIAEVRSGRKIIDKNGQVKSLPAPALDELQQLVDSNDVVTLQRLFEAHLRNEQINSFERSVNLRQIGLLAQEEAEHQLHQAVSEDPVDADWFARWRTLGQEVSREEMQRLWARILAGEVLQPGSFSIHAMDFLAKMSKKDADLLSKLAHFAISDVHVFSEADVLLAKEGLDVPELLYLIDLGLLNGSAGPGGLAMNIGLRPDPIRAGYFYGTFHYVDRIFVFYFEKAADPSIPAFIISSVGREILNLTTSEFHGEYINAVVKHLKNMGCVEVKVGAHQSGQPILIDSLEDYADFESL